MDGFEPPSDDSGDNAIRDQAAMNLYKGAAAAVGLGLFQYCCNPFWIITIMASGASMNAIRQPRWLKITLDEDFPESAGMISTVCGVIGICLVVGRVALGILSIGLLAADF